MCVPFGAVGGGKPLFQPLGFLLNEPHYPVYTIGDRIWIVAVDQMLQLSDAPANALKMVCSGSALYAVGMFFNCGVVFCPEYVSDRVKLLRQVMQVFNREFGPGPVAVECGLRPLTW
jgi:hypothetical protein